MQQVLASIGHKVCESPLLLLFSKLLLSRGRGKRGSVAVQVVISPSPISPGRAGWDPALNDPHGWAEAPFWGVCVLAWEQGQLLAALTSFGWLVCSAGTCLCLAPALSCCGGWWWWLAWCTEHRVLQ